MISASAAQHVGHINSVNMLNIWDILSSKLSNKLYKAYNKRIL